MPKLFHTVLLAATALTIGACSQSGGENAKLDNQIAGNEADPALTSALEDQIMVDPTLTQQSNRNVVRPAERPAQAQYPAVNPGQSKAGQAPIPAVNSSGCATGKFDYNPEWARRLPPELTIYPGGKLTEAAANNQGDCRMRVVTFTSADPAPRVLDWYRGRVQGAGYSADQQQRDGDQILAGSHAGKGSAYYLIVTPKQAGSEVAVIVNGV
nr:hypothetical protein [uncultured Sphingosinicella sp.]